MNSVRQWLPAFVLPFDIGIALIVAGLLLRRRWFIWAAVVILWLSSTPFLSTTLARAIERWAERLPAASAPAADAIVVLSTGRVTAPGAAAVSEWNDADRFYGGVELYRAKKAPLIIFTGASLLSSPDAELEGQVLARYATELGIPSADIRTTTRVTNTAEEADAVAKLLRQSVSTAPHVLLVTSAFHMTRAARVFAGAGLTVSEFPVDFRVSATDSVTVTDFLPNTGALAQTEAMLREWYGTLFYRLTRP